MSEGVRLSTPASHVSVFTGASLSGWGGTCQSQTVGAQWPNHMSLHINMLELLTVWKVTQHFTSLLSGSACSDPHRQQSGSSLHKSPGGCALGSAAKQFQAAAALGVHEPALHQSSVHPRRPEQRSGHLVQRWSSSRGLESLPRADCSDLEQIRESSSGSFRHTGKRTMPVVVFTEPTGGSTVRSGCLCSKPVAENTPLCFSSSSADPAAPGSGPRGTALSDSRSPRAQKRAMVSEPAAAGVRSPVAAAVERGCIPKGRRGDQERPRVRSASLGLAAERERLERLGLLHDSGRMSRLYHSVIRIKLGSFSALVCREWRGALFMSIRLCAVIPPAADEQKFIFQHH
ncbi:hypothetical protein AMECASPLE_029621 [Ameca splendens]|uniref:Uncharacterized protein n=1 Tax=Ameca splendens TaxID=208324 RepID=A0ABV0Y5U8_9TELE